MVELKKIEINNYKSIKNQNISFNLSSRILPIIGENNVGKTNILEAINILNTTNLFNDHFNNIKDFSNYDLFSNEINNGGNWNNINSPLGIELVYHFNFILEGYNLKSEIFLKYEKQKFSMWIPSFNEKIEKILKNFEIKIDKIFKLENLEMGSNLEKNLRKWFLSLKAKEINFDTYQDLTSVHNLLKDFSSINVWMKILNESLENFIYIENNHQQEIINLFKDLNKIFNSFILNYSNNLILPKINFISSLSYFDKRSFENIAMFKYNEGVIKGNFLWDYFKEFSGKKATQFLEEEIKNLDYNLIEINERLKEHLNFTISEIKNEKVYFVLSKDKESKDISIRFKFIATEEKTLDLLNQSPGARKRFILSAFFNYVKSSKFNYENIFIFDEPDTFLHIDSQVELLDNFFDLIKNNEKVKIIYSTHSIFMLDYRVIYNCLIINKNKKGLTEITKISDNESKYEKFFKGSLLLMYSSIGSKQVFINGAFKNILFVEGRSDFLYLSHFTRILNMNKNFEIWPVDSASKFDKYSDFFTLIGIKAVVLYDADDGEKSISPKLRKKWNFYKDMGKTNLESLFEEKFLENIQNNKRKLKIKKLIDKDLQDPKLEWSIETLNNFKLLLKNISEAFF